MAFAAPPAEAQASVPTASSAYLYLTIKEARQQIRGRHRRFAREDGEYVQYQEVGNCNRWSNRRVRCYAYVEYSDGISCEGLVQVIEFYDFYRTQGIGFDCY